MEGTYCRVEPINLGRHAADLYDANRKDEDGRIWTYLPYGPWDTFQGYRHWMETNALGADPMFYAIVDRRTDKAVGVAGYMRINPDDGVIEVGHINYSPLLQRTPAGTEAMFLMMRRVFDELGYRRYEWKCDALNAPSRAAAERLGFRFEGVFLQATMYKGRSRDSAWFAIIDKEWPAIKAAFERWLDPSNFSEQDRQRQRLSILTA
jgi:RimJ/RimL family protein N-acetyltransferase